MIDRIKLAKKLPSDAELARFLKVSTGTVSTWRKRNSMKVKDVLNFVSDLDMNWLLFGSESITNASSDHKHEPDLIYNKEPSPPPPVIEISPRAARTNTLIADVQASAGFGAIVENHREIEKLPAVHLPDAPHGLNVAFQVRGDSMHPTIRHLDYVAANKIHDVDEVKDGHTYVIVDDTDGVLCKRVYRLGADWQIVSDNPIYPPYNRSRGRILGIFRAFCRWSYDFRNYHDDVREDIRQLKADMQDLKNRK